MTINEILADGVILSCVAEVIHIAEPDDRHPYGHEQNLWRPHEPQDLKGHMEGAWADREIVSIWPIQDTRYPLLQIEVG